MTVERPGALSRTGAGRASVTPVPAQQRLGPHWYTGSADAIYQSMNLIKDGRPDIVIVFGADHVCRMDPRQMIDQHASNAIAAYLLQLHLDLFGCFCLPASLWLGVSLPLHPRGVLTTGVHPCSLRLNPSRCVADHSLTITRNADIRSTTRSTTVIVSVRITQPSWEPPIGIEPMTYALRGGLQPSTAVQTVTSALLARLLSPPASVVVQGRC